MAERESERNRKRKEEKLTGSGNRKKGQRETGKGKGKWGEREKQGEGVENYVMENDNLVILFSPHFFISPLFYWIRRKWRLLLMQIQ
jgi:hypothetical protein